MPPSEDLSLANVRSYSGHAARGDYLYGAESRILKQLVKGGTKVLEIGCGTGRVTRALLALGAEVHACDLEPKALSEAEKSMAGANISLQIADVRGLPFPDAQFDLVLFAFNGLDFLQPESERIVAIKEMNRVLKDGGDLVLSSHNLVGSILSPRGILRTTSLRTRLKILSSGLAGDSYAPDMAGMSLYHATPAKTIAQIEKSGPLRCVLCTNRDGNVDQRTLLTLFSAWPYYHFKKHDF